MKMPCKHLRIAEGKNSYSSTQLRCNLRKCWCRATRMLQCPDYEELNPLDLQPFALLWNSLRSNVRARYLNRLPHLQRWINDDLEVAVHG